jgi:hypothetical protein
MTAAPRIRVIVMVFLLSNPECPPVRGCAEVSQPALGKIADFEKLNIDVVRPFARSAESADIA